MPGPLREKMFDALTGLELGVLGGVLMLAWFALISPVLGQPWWTVPNLLGSKYYAARIVRSGPGLVTLSGGALHLVLAGIVGVFVGLLSPGNRLVALGAAVAWYLASYLYIWKRASPMLADYTWQPVLAAGYFIYGSVLGYHRARRARTGLADTM
jgi:hypothetical protein